MRTRPFYQAAFEAVLICGSSHLDPPGLIGSWKIEEFGCYRGSGGPHHGPLDDDAGIDVFPQRDKQLAGECFFRRPSFCFTRCLNHRLSAEWG